MRLEVIGTCALIRERDSRHIGSILSLYTDFEGTLHLGGKVYQKQNGAYRIHTNTLEKVNFPHLKGKGVTIRCEGFSYREGCVTPVGEDYADMLLTLFDVVQEQAGSIRALESALNAHRTSEHAPTLF